MMGTNKKMVFIMLVLLALVISGLMLFKFLVVKMEPPDSLIQLIATPKKFNNKQVRVAGFLQLEFEGNALYLHQEDAQFVMTANAVWIEMSDEMRANPNKFHNKHVCIDGVFNANGHGHMALFTGVIEDVSRCYLIENIRK